MSNFMPPGQQGFPPQGPPGAPGGPGMPGGPGSFSGGRGMGMPGPGFPQPGGPMGAPGGLQPRPSGGMPMPGMTNGPMPAAPRAAGPGGLGGPPGGMMMPPPGGFGPPPPGPGAVPLSGMPGAPPRAAGAVGMAGAPRPVGVPGAHTPVPVMQPGGAPAPPGGFMGPPGLRPPGGSFTGAPPGSSVTGGPFGSTFPGGPPGGSFTGPPGQQPQPLGAPFSNAPPPPGAQRTPTGSAGGALPPGGGMGGPPPPGGMPGGPPGPGGPQMMGPPGMGRFPPPQGGAMPPPMGGFGGPAGMPPPLGGFGAPGGMPPGPPGTRPPGQPVMMGQGPPAMMQQQQLGPPGMMQAGPPGMMQAGPPGMMQAGPPGMMQAGPPGMMPPGAPGMMQHGGPGMMGLGGGGMMAQGGGGYDPYGQQRVIEQFESLTMGGPNPGQEGVDWNALPRPVGELRDTALDPPTPYDVYNCSANNMRMTVNAIPNSTALRARWPLPFGAIVHPMADELHGRQVPVINLGAAGIIRCKRCRTYMNPFMTWTDGGRRFKCNVCALLNEIPVDYYCAMGPDGRRQDFNERPEFNSGTVEYIAPAEYMVRPPMPPVYFFVIDVSFAAVNSGMVGVAAKAIKGVLDELPGDERTLIGFLTFDSTLHFYNLKSSLTQPQMMVVAELDEPFLPLPDELLVNLKESRNVIDVLLDSLPNTFSTSNGTDSAMGPALQAAMMAMQHVGGKLQLFQCAVPNLGVGKIKNREAVNAYGTDREPALRQPEDSFYKRFASEASRNQITVDLYAFSLAYMDMASLVCLPRFTCGDVYHYPGFTAARDAAKLTHELQHNLRRPTAWEAVMRIRCSKGLRISTFHGHFFNRSTDLLALPTCDPDKAFAVQIAHEESLVSGNVGYVQCALLYTNSNGERRIRVHTLSAPVVTELSELFKASDGPACAALLGKVSLEKSLNSRLDETRAAIFNKVMQLLKEFRLLHGATARAANRMVFPEPLRCLPLWALSLTKCSALRGGAREVAADERAAVGHELMAASVEGMCRGVYPDLYPLHEVQGDWGRPRPDGSVPLPLTMPLTGAYLEESGAYLIDNGRSFLIWLGRTLDRNWGLEVFGVDLASPEASDPSRLQVEPQRDNAPMSARVNQLIRTLRVGRALHQNCFVVRQGSPSEIHIAPYFVEDRGPAMQSYPDWMMAIHKGVMAK